MLRDIQLFCINNMYRNKENEFEFSQFIIKLLTNLKKQNSSKLLLLKKY